MKRFVLTALLAVTMGASANAEDAEFTPEELEVAKFWEDMGPTLRDEGIDAYAIRYHEDFRHWNIQGSGRMGTKESAIKAWTGFHDAGHRITCTYVKPVSIDIDGDRAFARLEYEQTNTYADGRISTTVWRMFDIFERYGDTWQVLESNMVEITPKDDEDDAEQNSYVYHCPKT